MIKELSYLLLRIEALKVGQHNVCFNEHDQPPDTFFIKMKMLNKFTVRKFHKKVMSMTMDIFNIKMVIKVVQIFQIFHNLTETTKNMYRNQILKSQTKFSL